MPEIQTKDKLITLEELGAAINAKAGVTSVNSQTGAVSLTPANIGAVNTSAVIDIPHGGTEATTAAQARANLGLNGISTTQAQPGVTPVNDGQTHNINVIADCWVCASFHITGNVNGGIILTRNGVPIIMNENTNGACNYWANAQFQCEAGAILQYILSSNATDSHIYFYTV